MYGDKPYIFHLEQVYKIALDNGQPDSILIACLLQDVIEDCNISYNAIKGNFGYEVAELVFLVTDELGRDRRERKVKTYFKLNGFVNAIAIALCDRIANIEYCISNNNANLHRMYRDEHALFCLLEDCTRGRLDSLWTRYRAAINEKP